MPDIRMPDGTVIQNVPEGLTQAQLLSKLKANGYDTAKLLTPVGSTDAPADAVPMDGVAPVPAPVAVAPRVGTAEARLQARQPLKEVEAPGIFDYFTDRQGAIKQARERTAYMQELGQRGALEDIKTQTGFFDRLGDFFSRGLLSTTSSIKDAQRAIEADPELKKQFTEEARRFAADRGVEIKGATTEEDVKKNFLRNAIPYILEKGAESIPGMLAAGIPIPGLGLAQNFGSQGREAAELEGRQDVELSDLGKVAPGALAVTALDQLGLGGIFAAPAKTVLGRIGKAAMLEGGTEAIQSAIEYANPRVVTGSDIDAGEMFEQAAFGALVGGGIGGGGRGGIEAVNAALSRGKAEAADKTSFADSPDVEQEYLRLLTIETQALRDQNPDLTQRQAFNQAVKDAGKLYDTAIVNTMLGPEGEADVVSDVDTGVDVTGGVGAGAAPDIEPSATPTGAPDLGEAVAGGLERPVPSVPIPAVGEGTGVDTLAATPAPEVVAPTPVFDITPIMEAPTRKERTSAAKFLASDIVMENPELQGLPAKTYGQAVNQMVNAASRGEQFDPVDIIYKVAEIERPAPAAPAPAFEPMAAPDVPAAPSVDEVAVAPVKAAIEAAAAPTPTAGPVPTLAETAAREVGITPAPPPPPPVQAAPVTPPAPPEMAAPTIEPTPAPPAVRTVNDMAGIGTVNPDNTNEVLVEGGGIQLTPLADNILKVDSLRAVETGGGRKAMERLTEVADANGTELQLSPEPFAAEAGKEMTPTELSNWYAGFGFQEQPDGTMVRPAPTAAPSTITPADVPTPQEILADLDSFAISEAQDRDLDQDMFLAGVDDVRNGKKPRLLIDPLESEAYKAGTQFAQDRIAEVQAATAPTAKPDIVEKPAQTGSRSLRSGLLSSVSNAVENANAATQNAIYRMQDAWRVLTGKPILANARLTDLLRDPDILNKMNPAQRELAAALADVIDDDVNAYIGNTNFSLQEVFTLGTATFYGDTPPEVRLRGVSTAANIVTLLHEAVHIALTAKFGVSFNRLNDIGFDADPEMVALRNEASKLIDAYNTMADVEGSTDPLLSASPYGMTNLDEFIAEGLTQPSFQKFLEKGNLWTRFVTLVRKLLKLQPKFQPQLDTVLKAGAKLIAASKKIDRMYDVTGTLEQRKKSSKPTVVSNGKPVVLTEAQKRTALAKAKAAREKMNRIQKRIASTNDTADVLSGGIDLVKLARGDKENLALLRGAIDAVDAGKWQLVLPVLSTEDIFRILKGRIPGLIESDRITRQDIPRFQSKEYGLLAEELEQVSEFLKKYPKAAQALSDLEFATVAYQVDPTKAATPEEYAKLDKKTKELQTELGSVTAGDAKGKKKVEDKIARRLADIKSVYAGVPGDERVLGWRDLGRPEFGGNKGKEIFKLIRDAHRRDLETKYNMLRSRLMETKKDKELAEALEKLEAQFKPAREQVIYFPAMRFGSYYARVGTGANSVFKMFETRLKRNQFVRLMKARGEEVTDIGNVEDLRNNFEQVSGGPLKEVLDLFDGDPKDIGALKSQVFDLWLQTMSAGDMRKHMAPRKMRAGYSTDILKNFANFRRSSINDVKRAKFGEQLRLEISRAKDMVKDMPDREKMEVFIKEIELRTLNSMMPQTLTNSTINKMIELGNKAAFYQYLANPKTGVIQLTQLHIVALPILAQKYGHINATAALAKYGFSALGGFAASPFTSVKKEDGSYTFNWEQPTLLDNPVTGMKKESDPELYEVLSEGWVEGRDLNLWLDTFANEIGGFANVDPQQRSALQDLMQGRVHTATWRGGVFVLDAMGSLMHQMERVNREATYMAALELAYRENKKKGQSHAEAKKNAIEAAVDTTLAATFDFSSYNKPRILTSPVGRVAGQFYSFPYMMSSLLLRKMYTAIYFGKLEPGERVAAIEIATGTLANLFMYAGVKGIPLYGLGVGIASTLLWLASQFDDDEEEGGLSYIDKDGNIKATYNVDWWIRNVWIPKFFGKDGTTQNLFGYDDDTAATVALSVEKGPISAITDVDLSNSVALDFMFFVPDEPRAKTPEGVAGEFLVNFLGGATVSTGIDYYKAIDDLMNGYTNRALEKTPKVFSNVAKANRFAEEGQLNYDRELVGMPEEFWTSDKVFLQSLGFASTEASQRQEQNYEGRKIGQKVKAARDDILAKFRKLALDKHQFGFTPEVAEAHKKTMKEWGEYNRTYPTDIISIDTLYEVENNAVNNVLRSEATRGVPLDDKGKTPYMMDILKRRVEAEK